MQSITLCFEPFIIGLKVTKEHHLYFSYVLHSHLRLVRLVLGTNLLASAFSFILCVCPSCKTEPVVRGVVGPRNNTCHKYTSLSISLANANSTAGPLLYLSAFHFKYFINLMKTYIKYITARSCKSSFVFSSLSDNH